MINILLTNICNGRCPYCFASTFLSNELKKCRELSLTKLDIILDYIYRYDPKSSIHLLGGEPTLYSNFEEMIKLILKKKFNKIILFSNGIISPNNIAIIKKYKKYISIIWNINPPEVYPPKLYQHVYKTIQQLSLNTSTIGFNIFKTKYDFEFIYSILIQSRHINTIRIGLAHPIGCLTFSSAQKFIGLRDYPKIGSTIYSFILKINNEFPYIENISFDCGYTPCLFSPEQLACINKLKKINIYSLCEPMIVIDPDLRIHQCLAIPNNNANPLITQFKNIEQIYDYQISQYTFINKYLPPAHKKCIKCMNKANCMSGCMGERRLEAERIIQKYERYNAIHNPLNNQHVSQKYEITKLYMGLLEFGKVNKLLPKQLVVKDKAKNTNQNIQELNKAINNYIRITKNLSFSNIKDNNISSKIIHLKKNYLAFRDNTLLYKYAFFIKYLLSSYKNNKKDQWKVKEIMQFTDIIWNIRFYIKDPLITLIIAESLKFIEKINYGSNYYKTLSKKNPFVYRKLITYLISEN